MVDLGFLLITFFIFTSSIAEPVATNLFMPKDGPDLIVTTFSQNTVSITDFIKTAMND